MKASRIATFAALVVLVLGVAVSRADDQAPAAVPPADAAPKVLEPLGGCMPDGGCCGHPACAHAAAAAEKATNGSTTGGAADTNAADNGGGCPCAKMKKKAM